MYNKPGHMRYLDTEAWYTVLPLYVFSNDSGTSTWLRFITMYYYKAMGSKKICIPKPPLQLLYILQHSLQQQNSVKTFMFFLYGVSYS